MGDDGRRKESQGKKRALNDDKSRKESQGKKRTLGNESRKESRGTRNTTVKNRPGLGGDGPVADLGGGGGGHRGHVPPPPPPPFPCYTYMRKSLPCVTYEPSRNAKKWTASITSFFSPVAKCTTTMSLSLC